MFRLIGRIFHRKQVDEHTKFSSYRRFRCGNHRTGDNTAGCGYEFEHYERDEWCGPFNSVVQPAHTKYVYLLDGYRDCMNNLVDIGPVTNKQTITRARVRSGRR
jgi:hypothetical protein